MKLLENVAKIDDADVESDDKFEKISVEEFSSCFHLRHLVEKDSGDKIGEIDVSIDSLKIAESKLSTRKNLFKFCVRLGRRALHDFDAAKWVEKYFRVPWFRQKTVVIIVAF